MILERLSLSSCIKPIVFMDSFGHLAFATVQCTCASVRDGNKDKFSSEETDRTLLTTR